MASWPRRKILFAINCLNIGGAPSVVLAQLKSLDCQRFDPYILTLYPSKEANFLDEINKILPSDHQFHCRLKNRSLFDFKTLWSIFHFLRQERFDIICTHLFLTNLIVRFLAISSTKSKIISYEHSIYEQKKFWQRTVDRFLSFFTHKIITPTKQVADFTSIQEGIPANKFLIINNPISIPDRSKINVEQIKKDYLINNKLVFLTIGRFSEEKGHELIIRAVAKIVNPDNVKFIIVGHGPLYNYLSSLVVELGLQSVVYIVNNAEKAKEFLYVADVFILPSLREGQGIVAYEAFLAGIPVLSADLPVMRNLIKEGKNGRFFTTGDVDSLSREITKLLARPTDIEQLKENIKSMERGQILSGQHKFQDFLLSIDEI